MTLTIRVTPPPRHRTLEAVRRAAGAGPIWMNISAPIPRTQFYETVAKQTKPTLVWDLYDKLEDLATIAATHAVLKHIRQLQDKPERTRQ